MKITFVILFLPFCIFGQIKIAWNAELDLELSKAGKVSHYFYNEIHRDFTDWRFDMARTHLLATATGEKGWEINSHLLLEREQGKKAGLFKELEFYTFQLPLLNIKKTFEDKHIAVTIGRFLSPFGSFYKTQLNKDRTFLAAPLAYSHYNNISNYLGWVDGLGENTKIRVNNQPEWGSPILYQLGYKTGIQLQWESAKKTNVAIALVDGAANQINSFTEPFNWAVVSKVQFQPTYFSKIGFSLSHGAFMERASLNSSIKELQKYRQTLIGIDYNIGKGFFELSGELIQARYNVPAYLSDLGTFQGSPRIQSSIKQAWSAYGDLKYELSYLPGSYVAYRFDVMFFDKTKIKQQSERWDQHIRRHSLAIGYKINTWLELKSILATQQIAEQSWNTRQRLFRTMLIFHW